MFNSSAIKLVAVFVFLAFLSGCASKRINPIPLDPESWASEQQRVGIVVAKLPETDITYPGASCLLCIGAASAMNSTLSSHVSSLDASDLYSIQQDLADAIESSGKPAVLIEEHLVIEKLPDYASDLRNSAEKDFREIGKSENITHLLVVDIDYVGFQRSYASYIPTSPPFAKLVGNAFLVDINTNVYNWYFPVDINEHTEGEWDEPDDFPGLTNAFYQAIEKAKEHISQPLMIDNKPTI